MHRQISKENSKFIFFMFVFLKLVKVLGVLIPFSPFKKTGVLEITLK